MKHERRRGAADSGGLWKIGLLVVVAGACLWLWLPRATYPRIGSAESDQLMRKLATACGSQNAERLQVVKDELAKLEMSEVERQAFQRIIDMADRGSWREAHQASIQFATDQVR